MDYKEKYLNYKKKYLELKNKQIGGGLKKLNYLKPPNIFDNIYSNIYSKEIYNLVTQDEKNNFKNKLDEIKNKLHIESILKIPGTNEKTKMIDKLNKLNDDEKNIQEKNIIEVAAYTLYIGTIINSKKMHNFNILFNSINNDDNLYTVKIIILVCFFIMCKTLDDDNTFEIFKKILNDCKNNNTFISLFFKFFNEMNTSYLNNKKNNEIDNKLNIQNNILNIQDRYLEQLFSNIKNSEDIKQIKEFSENISNIYGENNKITEYIKNNDFLEELN